MKFFAAQVVLWLVFVSGSAFAEMLAEHSKDESPWLSLPPPSEQHHAVYIGATPYEMFVHGKIQERPRIPLASRELLEKQLRKVLKKLRVRAGEFEVWPAQNDLGRRVWVIARIRKESPKSSNAEWHWLNDRQFERVFKDDDVDAPLFPRRLLLDRNADHQALFADFLDYQDLYQKPVFGDAVFVDRTGKIVSAWNAPDSREAFAATLQPRAGMVAYVMNPPARFNGQAATFVVTVTNSKFRYSDEIEWTNVKQPEKAIEPEELRVSTWPEGFLKDYQNDVYILSGNRPAGDLMFQRKNSADPAHQLEAFNDYLELRYALLGIKTLRQRFLWRGIPQSNLIAVIPGTNPPESNHPVLMADHIDTAFSHDVFEKNKTRVSTAGADDNVTAVAALLRAAEVLRAQKPKHDIWLTHLTGEEFPAEGIGIRLLLAELLKQKRAITGMVLLDMIGWRRPHDKVVQFNSGASVASQQIARRALDAFSKTAPHLKGVFRERFDRKSYLYNTDGVFVSDTGFPVMLINEHVNYEENLERPHYHHTTDQPNTLDWPYAIAVVKTAIETVARLAGL